MNGNHSALPLIDKCHCLHYTLPGWIHISLLLPSSEIPGPQFVSEMSVAVAPNP